MTTFGCQEVILLGLSCLTVVQKTFRCFLLSHRSSAFESREALLNLWHGFPRSFSSLLVQSIFLIILYISFMVCMSVSLNVTSFYWPVFSISIYCLIIESLVYFYVLWSCTGVLLAQFRSHLRMSGSVQTIVMVRICRVVRREVFLAANQPNFDSKTSVIFHSTFFSLLGLEIILVNGKSLINLNINVHFCKYLKLPQ